MLPHDKANHVVYGAVIATVGTIFAGPVVGLIAAGVVGAVKEILDNFTGGSPDIEDAIATLGGGILVVLPWLVQ